MKLLIFSLLVIVQYLMDRFTSTCATYTGEVLLFFHHIMAVYIYFGPLFFNPFYHLLFCVILLIHWHTYKACIVTKWTNYYCGVDMDRPFHDYVRLLKLYKIYEYIHWHMIYVLIIYDVCLIWNKKY